MVLKIVQAGEAGKTSFLYDMHRLRKRVFKDKMRWNVTCSPDGLEVDEFDLPDTVYVLALDDEQRVIGNWRLLPTTGPTMIRNVWPQFLETITIPSSTYVWECSRFAVDSLKSNSAEGFAQVQHATKELYLGVAEMCFMCGIQELFALYDYRIKRILRRLNCRPYARSAMEKIDGIPVEVAAFRIDEPMIANLRASTGIKESLVSVEILPPLLREYYQKGKTHEKRQSVHHTDIYAAAERSQAWLSSA